MLEILLVIGAFVVLHRQLALLRPSSNGALAPRQSSARLVQLSTYADRLFSEKKWLAAEKAYLNVLKLDHKNVTAFCHLGIIYSTQKNMADAIECFQIAARLRPSATAYQNLGVAYFENHNAIKSIAAWEKSIMFEPSALRYIGLSRAQTKLSNTAEAITALEKAAALDPSRKTLGLLADAYETAGRKQEATDTYRRIHEADPTDAVAARKIGLHLPTTPKLG